MKYLKRSIHLFLLTILLNGCTSMAYKPTGDILIGYVNDNGVDYLLSTDDPQAVYRMSENLGPLLLSFGRVTQPPDRLAIFLNFLSGLSIEQQAKEEQLRYLRAIFKKDVTEARDAQIGYKRDMALAARRELKAYQSMT